MDDVVVVELRRQLRLIDEHVDEFAIVGKMRQDFLDRDDFLKSFHAAHPRLPHFGHSAGGDLFEKNVLTESRAVGRLFFLHNGRRRRSLRREHRHGDRDFFFDGGRTRFRP